MKREYGVRLLNCNRPSFAKRMLALTTNSYVVDATKLAPPCCVKPTARASGTFATDSGRLGKPASALPPSGLSTKLFGNDVGSTAREKKHRNSVSNGRSRWF